MAHEYQIGAVLKEMQKTSVYTAKHYGAPKTEK